MCHLTGDCHDSYGKKDRCVSGAIYNYSKQLEAYQRPESEQKCKICSFQDTKIMFCPENLSTYVTEKGLFVDCR